MSDTLLSLKNNQLAIMTLANDFQTFNDLLNEYVSLKSSSIDEAEAYFCSTIKPHIESIKASGALNDTYRLIELMLRFHNFI